MLSEWKNWCHYPPLWSPYLGHTDAKRHVRIWNQVHVVLATLSCGSPHLDSLLAFSQFTPLSSTFPTQDVEFLNLKSLCGDFKFDFHFNFFFLHYCLCSKKLLCLWRPFTQIAMLGQALFRCKKSQVVSPSGMCNPGLHDSLLFQSMLPLASLAYCQPISTPAC